MRRLSQTEFVIIMALMFSVIAVSIDSMLPALPAISAALSPGAPNKAHLVVSFFVLGLGLGIFVAGPLSDRFGRRITILGGFAIYGVAALVAANSQSLDALIGARFVQGLGAAAPRVVGLAMTRDLYEGRGMARITSIVMMIFMIIPAVGPFLGQQVMLGFGWRAVFAAYAVFALIAGGWLALRQGETLRPEDRRPLRLGAIWTGTREVMAIPQVTLSIIALSFCMAMMMSMLVSVQPIYEQVFDKADTFPLWFGASALLALPGTVINASLVMRLGMRRLIVIALTGAVALTLPVLAYFWTNPTGNFAFAVFFIWLAAMIFSNGLTFGNLNAMALQPVGHMAGLASSLAGAISTIAAAVLSVPVGLLFDGTPRVLMIAMILFSGGALLFARKTVEDQPALA